MTAKATALTTTTYFVTVQETSQLARVSDETVCKWIRDGVLPAKRIGPRQYRILRTDLEKFLGLAQE